MSKITGVVTRGKGEAEEADGALFDVSNVTLQSGERVIRASSVDFEAVTGWMAFSGNTSTGFRYAAYFQPETDGDAKILGIGVFPYIKSGGASDRMQVVSSVMTVEGTLQSRSGDATAGAHNFWGKFGADLSSATIASGARIAPFWSDIQVNNGDVSSEEVFHILCSAGGSGVRAVMRVESSALPHYFLETDKGLGSNMLDAQSGGAYEACNSNAQTGNILVDINGTTYAIPLMAAS